MPGPIEGLQTAGVLGGGVIGGGWAARFILNGVDVKMYDPDPQAERKVGEVMANARRSLHRLTMAPLPAEGRLTIVATPEEASTGVDFVQESVPERVELKQHLLAAASAVAPASVVFGSSTSGLLPTLLAEKMTLPERFVVGHPFNPVYLLPLVEICGGVRTSSFALERASEVYTSIGMRPLLLKKEIDGFVADRLLEALWREALWLVNDGVATVSEIDDAIRFGAGLRWSFMGTFLTYRIAGGEAGMAHFMAQFGPALKWPWTKLMDVPDLDETLLNTIVSQSDDQAGGLTVRQLEALRDDCLVTVMQGLRTVPYGAGEVLDQYERTLLGRLAPATDSVVEDQPLRLSTRAVPTHSIDYHGQVNDSREHRLTSTRVMRGDEYEAMREVSVAAFGGDDRMRRLIDALRTSWAWENELSFVAECDGEVVGQVLYSHAILDTPTQLVDVLVLSPVGVRPELQRSGIGRQLIETSLAALRARPEPLVFLEGHPGYYPRFGFVPAAPLGFTAPSVRIPPPAFMVYRLPNFEPWMTGALVYPDAFWRTDCVGLRP